MLFFGFGINFIMAWKLQHARREISDAGTASASTASIAVMDSFTAMIDPTKTTARREVLRFSFECFKTNIKRNALNCD